MLEPTDMHESTRTPHNFHKITHLQTIKLSLKQRTPKEITIFLQVWIRTLARYHQNNGDRQVAMEELGIHNFAGRVALVTVIATVILLSVIML